MIEDTLRERGNSYGEFIDNAEIAQALKEVIRHGNKWGAMEDDQREAVHMICSKISRMVTGDPDHIDNWTDIQGFAKLVEDRLNEEANRGASIGGDEDYLPRKPLSFKKWFEAEGFKYQPSTGFYSGWLCDHATREDVQDMYKEYSEDPQAANVGRTEY